MSDIFSVLQNAYATAPLTPSNTKYTAVDPKSYQGSWTGTYSNNQKFRVDDFRRQRLPRPGQISERSTTQYQQC